MACASTNKGKIASRPTSPARPSYGEALLKIAPLRGGAALDVSRIELYERALIFNQKSTLSSDGSSALFWASDETPVIVARIDSDDILSVAENPNQDWQKWADTNAEVLIGIAGDLFRSRSYKYGHGMRVINIGRDKLDAKKSLFRSVPDIRP